MEKFYVNPDISRAHTISTEVYRSESFFEMAKEKIFAGSWQFAGDRRSAPLATGSGLGFGFARLEAE